MRQCEASNKTLTGGVIEIRHKKMYATCPECNKEVEIGHSQRKNSEFTARTGFADMVPYVLPHLREEEPTFVWGVLDNARQEYVYSTPRGTVRISRSLNEDPVHGPLALIAATRHILEGEVDETTTRADNTTDSGEPGL